MATPRPEELLLSKVSLYLEMGHAKIFNEIEFLYNGTSIICALFSVLFVQFINLLNKFSEHLNIQFSSVQSLKVHVRIFETP